MSRNSHLGVIRAFTGAVTPRKRRVSRNKTYEDHRKQEKVTPRKRRVSRNEQAAEQLKNKDVTPRKRRVSRNGKSVKRHQ